MQQTIARWVDRLRDEYPDTVAMLLKGSYARGEAAFWSDIDFDVLVSSADIEDYRTWLEPAGERLVHISAGVESLEGWLRDCEEPSSWSYGLPTQETARLMWAESNQLRQQLDRPFKSHPAADPEVEDTLEALGKIRNANARGDDIGVYQAARIVAQLIPTLLIPINPAVVVSHARQAIEVILAFPNVPNGFAEDWLTCLGFVDDRTARSTADAAQHMVRGVIPLLPPDPAIVGDDIVRLLVDGSIQTYMNQGEAQ